MSQISGLQLEFTGVELQELCAKRIEYHKSKAEFFEAEAARLGPAMEEFADRAETIGKFSNSGSNAVSDLKGKAKQARDRVTYFTVLTTHMPGSNTYLLDHSDLVRLEILAY